MTIEAVSPVRHEFAARIRRAREDLGWSRYELARRCARRHGMRWHQTIVVRFEEETSTPSLVQAVVLCDVLGITLFDLHLEPRDEPWIDGALATLQEIDDRVAGRVELSDVEADPVTGARETHVVTHEPWADLGELPEIPEEDR